MEYGLLDESHLPILGEMELSVSAQSRQHMGPSIGPPFRCRAFLPRDGSLRNAPWPLRAPFLFAAKGLKHVTEVTRNFTELK